MNHTAEPWKAECNPSNIKQWMVIASTHETVVYQVAGGKDHAEANARLIAAAPNMLKALKGAKDALEAAGMGCPSVIAAIDEAEGRT